MRTYTRTRTTYPILLDRTVFKEPTNAFYFLLGTSFAYDEMNCAWMDNNIGSHRRFMSFVEVFDEIMEFCQDEDILNRVLFNLPDLKSLPDQKRIFH